MCDIRTKLLILERHTRNKSEQGQYAKKVKYTALIPIGHRIKTVEGMFESASPITVNTMKDLIKMKVRNKHNTGICFVEVEIENFEILE